MIHIGLEGKWYNEMCLKKAVIALGLGAPESPNVYAYVTMHEHWTLEKRSCKMFGDQFSVQTEFNISTRGFHDIVMSWATEGPGYFKTHVIPF